MANSSAFSDDPTIVFLGINKTGTSTLQTVLVREYGLPRTLQINPHREPVHSLTIDEFKNLPESARMEYRAISGHMFFNWGIHDYIPRPFQYISVLRDPVDRVVSFYYYLLAKSSHDYSVTVSNNCKNIEDFVTKGYAWNDLMVKYLSLEDKVKFDPVQAGALEIALENFDKYFNVFGLTERFLESVTLFKRYFNWKSLPVFRKGNITKKRPKVKELSAKTLDLIREYNSHDIALYDLARKRFDQLISAQDESFNTEVADLERMNDIYSEKVSDLQREAVYHNGRAEHLLKRKDFDNAFISISSALQLKPDYVDAHNNMGVYYSYKGEFEQALKCFYKALEINPFDEDSVYNSTELLKHSGRIDEAAKIYRTCLEYYPADIEIRNLLEEIEISGV